MHQQLKSQLEEAGELMVQMSDGKAFELHLHNTHFSDDYQLIEVDTGTERYWLKSDEIIYSWIHRSAS